MRLQRLLGIVYLLLGRGSSTAAELAERVGVSKKTILRDVDELSAAGLPVYAVRGRGGGIALMRQYSLGRAELSAEEQDQVLLALQAFLVSRQPGAVQPAALEKLRALFRRPESDWIEIDFACWGRQGDDERFESLKAAIISQRAVAFEYSGLNGGSSSRKAYPLRLVFKAFAWYLQAFCQTAGGYRSFKLNRMRELTTLEEPFDRGAFQPPAIGQAESAPELWLTLRFSKRAAYRVYDEFDREAVRREEDGSLLVKALFSDGPWLYDYLLSLGPEAELLEPEGVRQSLMGRIEAMQAPYLGKKGIKG
ncbi:MAG: YafY family transcriptional regulator [Christensenellaceae bacterium]|jgi:predicted DNA-binding transcriptional regulator YafY|nr:YafY family transcriptional regulator [Christensenellaceae bacterium]